MTTRAGLSELIESRSMGGLCAVDPYRPTAPGGISAWDMQQVVEQARAVLMEAVAQGGAASLDCAFREFNFRIDKTFEICDAVEAD